MIWKVFRRANVALLSCALVVAFAAGDGFAQTQSADKTAAKFSGPGGHAAMLSKAESAGTVRTMVRVEAPFTPDLSLSQDEVLSQRAAISKAQQSLVSELQNAGIQPTDTYRYKYIPYVYMKVDKAGLAALAASSHVSSIEEDVPDRATAPGWDILQVDATALHTAGHTGSGANVAVLDTGVDKTHPYLAGAVVSEACYSSIDPTYGSLSLCPGGSAESTAVGSAMPYASGVCPTGECDHGTHVSGTVAGRNGVAGSPGPGMAPDAGIIAIQVFAYFPPGALCGNSACALSFTSDQIKGLERVYALRGTYPIAAVNMSLGGSTQYTSAAQCNAANSSRKAAIDLLRQAGIAAVISSGNDNCTDQLNNPIGCCGTISAPACISTAVSVGATDDNDAVASYSNSASFMSLLAPGSDITSSVPGTTYQSWNGTSMAAPHVAGAWALIKADRPTATVTEVLNGLVATGVSVTDTGKCASVTKKRINVFNAYNRLIPPPVIVVSPAAVNFGNVKLGIISAARTITIRNNGPAHGAPLNVGTISVSNPAEFTLTGASCTPIARGGSCAFTVQLNATGYGSRTADLTITSDAPRKPTVTIKLMGNARPPVASVAPLVTNFGAVLVGVPSPARKITIRNTGFSDLSIVSIVPGGSGSFTVDSSLCPATLAQGRSCQVSATFTPAATGDVSGTIVVTTNDPDARRTVITATLKGRGR